MGLLLMRFTAARMGLFTLLTKVAIRERFRQNKIVSPLIRNGSKHVNGFLRKVNLIPLRFIPIKRRLNLQSNACWILANNEICYESFQFSSPFDCDQCLFISEFFPRIGTIYRNHFHVI